MVGKIAISHAFYGQKGDFWAPSTEWKYFFGGWQIYGVHIIEVLFNGGRRVDGKNVQIERCPLKGSQVLLYYMRENNNFMIGKYDMDFPEAINLKMNNCSNPTKYIIANRLFWLRASFSQSLITFDFLMVYWWLVT